MPAAVWADSSPTGRATAINSVATYMADGTGAGL